MSPKTELKVMLYAKNSYKYMMMKKKLFSKFKLKEVRQDFIFPYKISPYKKNKYVKVEHFKNMSKNIFNTFRENLGEHLLITARIK